MLLYRTEDALHTAGSARMHDKDGVPRLGTPSLLFLEISVVKEHPSQPGGKVGRTLQSSIWKGDFFLVAGL